MRPERGALLRRTLKRACEQDLPAGVALTEVLVLDDGPHAHAAAHIAAALPNGAPRCVRLRHVSVPPDASGRVSMRLKRNVALLLASADALCFFDDDDWRARDSVATQLAVLGDADVCTLQVQHVCELDASRRAARYFGLADGGGIFSRRLGNPGTMLLRRRAWEANSDLGFPETACEDVDFVRLLTADEPALDGRRGRRCAHTLVDAAALRLLGGAESRRSKMMTVRLLGFAHEWALPPLALPPMNTPPQCLDAEEVAFYDAQAAALADGAVTVGGGGGASPEVPTAAVLAEAQRRLDGATAAVKVLDAAVAQRARRRAAGGGVGRRRRGGGGGGSHRPTGAARRRRERATAAARRRRIGGRRRGRDNGGGACAVAAARGPSDDPRVAQAFVDGGALRSLAFLLDGAPPVPRWRAAACELTEELCFRTAPRTAADHARLLPPPLLVSLAGALAGANADGCVAAAAGAVQHLLRHASQQATLRALPRGAAALVGALRHASPTVRRRAAGAVANGSADGALCEALVAAGAVGSLLASRRAGGGRGAAARGRSSGCVWRRRRRAPSCAPARARRRRWWRGCAAAPTRRWRRSARRCSRRSDGRRRATLRRRGGRQRRGAAVGRGYTGRTLEAWEPAKLASASEAPRRRWCSWRDGGRRRASRWSSIFGCPRGARRSSGAAPPLST